MGTAQVKSKSNTKSLIEPPKIQIRVEVDINKAISPELVQLTNWSLFQIRQSYLAFQRISESPVVDCFLFKKMMPLNKKNSDHIFSMLAQGQKYISVFEIVCVLILTSYQTYRRKFQFLCLIFDLQHKGNINGRQFIYFYYSMLFGYCRLTNQALPQFEKVQAYAQAVFFPGQDFYEQKLIGLHKFVQQYDGNSNISHIFTRFQHSQLKQIKDDLLVYSLAQFKRYTTQQAQRCYRILNKIYSKNDFEQIIMMEENLEMRRQNRRDQCFRKLIQQKSMVSYESPRLKKLSSSSNKFSKAAPQSEKLIKLTKTPKCEQFRIKRVNSIGKLKPPQMKKNFFLNGQSHTKNQIFQAISYFKTLSGNQEKIGIKDFFKKFDKKVFLKKQLSNIFKYLDFEKKGELTLMGFFKSIYPGIKQDQLLLISKWYSEYQQIYQADSLIRNQPKVVTINDARELPYETIQRIRQIFVAMDIGRKQYLNFQDLRKAYKQGFTPTQLENLLAEYGDGKKIKFNNFCRLLLPLGWTIQNVNLQTVTLTKAE